MRTVSEVIANHLKSFGERDLDAILSDYAPEAVLFTPQGPIAGLDAIRAFFRALLAEFTAPGASRFELRKLLVHEDHGFIVWAAETAEHVYELGTDTFFVRDGRIRTQSYASQVRRAGAPRTS